MSLVIQDRELNTARFEPLGGDELESAIREVLGREAVSGIPIQGSVHAVKRNGDGEISFEAILHNIVTSVGNEYYGERAAAIASPPDQVSGMRLGTGTTAVATSGAGAAIVTHVTGSNVAISATYPQSSIPSGTIRRIIWASSWAAGVATNAALAEAVITNLNPIGTGAGAAADTISRVLLSPTINKGASDTLDLTWNHDLGQ